MPEAALAAGADGFFRKPDDLMDMVKAIGQLLSEPHGPGVPEFPPGPGSLPSCQALPKQYSTFPDEKKIRGCRRLFDPEVMMPMQSRK